MKNNIKNLNASVYAKLQNKAKHANCPFSEILQHYGMERFLYRFSRSRYADKFILKGALMFTVWQVPERRMTLDIDLSANYSNQIAGIEKVIKDICIEKVEPDGLVFDAKTIKGQLIRENADYEGVRVKFTGFLERSRISMQIDIGFGDIIYPKADTIDYPVILDFPKPHLKGYPVESVVSEKFESMIKLGLLNSRMKDFYDIWLIMNRFIINGEQFAESLKRTFTQRKTALPRNTPFFAEEIHDEKSDRQTLWKAFLRKNSIKHTPDKLSVVAKDIEMFLIRPVETINKGNKFTGIWKPSDKLKPEWQ